MKKIQKKQFKIDKNILKDVDFQNAIKIITEIISNGFIAYLAGGSVRDIIMGKKPSDYDIATSAKPEEIEKIFKNTKPVGKQFGVILVIKNKKPYEVATFRVDIDYSDGRRPDKVKFTNAEEDALRRDFTINGIFYDPIKNKIIDYSGGVNDIKNKILRFIGNAEERIKEDNLRILRAIRFKNKLGFKYHSDVIKNVKKHASLINGVSKERIKDELNKMLLDKSREKALIDLDKTGLIKQILPELLNMKGVAQPDNWHKEGDVWVHTLLCMKGLSKNEKLEVIWATLLHDVGKPETFEIRHRICFYGHCEKSAEIADSILKRLKIPNNLREKIVFLVANHLRHKDIMRMKEHRARRWANHEWFEDLLAVWLADAKGCLPLNTELYDFAKKIYDEEMAKPQKPKKLVSGNDIMEILDLQPSPEVGKILELIEDLQWEGTLKTKDDVTKYVEKLKQEN
jgi:poly(A) polymerase